MVYGKRKVGKTTLLTHALEDSKDETVYYECVKAPLKDNIDNFVNVLYKESVIPAMVSFTTLQYVFSYLNTLIFTKVERYYNNGSSEYYLLSDCIFSIIRRIIRTRYL